jgi:hypothetical protein
MKKVCLLVFSCLAIMLAGCAAPSRPLTAEEVRYLSTGPGPLPNNYQEIVVAYMEEVLIDPDSARYSGWKGPNHGTAQDLFGRNVIGWLVCADINAKNRMGGYTGRQQYFFLIHGDKVVVKKGGYRAGTVGWQKVYDLCNGL